MYLQLFPQKNVYFMQLPYVEAEQQLLRIHLSGHLN